VHIRQGQLQQEQGDADGALAAFAAAQKVDEGFLATEHGDKRAQRDLGVAQELVASVVSARDPARALALYQALLPPAEALAAADPTNAEVQRDLLVGYEDVAQMHDQLGHWKEALELQRKALAIAEALLRADPSNLQALQDLSVRHAQIGDVLLHEGDLPAALDSYQRSLDIDARVAAREPTNAKAAEYLGWSHLNVAGVLVKLTRRDAALTHYGQALEAATPFAERDPKNADLRLVLAEANAGTGEELLAAAGRGTCPEPARAALARALAQWQAVTLEPGPDKDHRDQVAARLSACGSHPPAGGAVKARTPTSG
jgi:tetratricopeptide (TPR) repeat protein